MKTSREIFATNLRNKLDAKQKKQSDLARFLGVSAVAVSRWVNGDAMPRAEMIDGICRFLVCTPEDLMTDHSKTVVMLPQDIIAEVQTRKKALIIADRGFNAVIEKGGYCCS